MLSANRLLAILVLLGFCSPSLLAHPLAPALLKIDMQSHSRADVLWKESSTKAVGVELAPVFPANCQKITVPEVSAVETAVLYQWKITCEEPLVGQEIHIQGLQKLNASVLVDYGDSGGTRTSSLLTQHRAVFLVPTSLSTLQMAKEYGLSGVIHLVSGWDHLFFVLGLFVLLYRQLRKLLLAITAFTVGHSITLALVGLGLIPVLGDWIEVLIALSITFLALEILNPNIQWFGFSIRRYPYLLTMGFGLIHGCGFASLLAEMLSNTSTKLLPLVSFNIGIEIGQCIMLVFFTAVITMLNRLPIPTSSVNYRRWKLPAVGYGLGVMSVYWLIVRSIEI